MADEQLLTFSFRAGYVNAFYFILLDLVALSLFDIAFAKVASAQYLRRIRKGKALRARSTDIPGVSSYLIGGYLLPINMIILLIKVLLFTAICLMEVDIEGRVIHNGDGVILNGNYVFNTSVQRDTWDDYEVVEKQLTIARDCVLLNQSANTIEFYNTAFNLTGDQLVTIGSTGFTATDYYDAIPIRKDTIQCLSPEFVLDASVRRSLKVVGCSQVMGKTTCTNESVVSVPMVIPSIQDARTMVNISLYTLDGTTVYTTAILFGEEDTRYRDSIAQLSNDYKDANSVCLFWYTGNDAQIEDQTGVLHCLVDVYFATTNSTLVERWDYNFADSQFERSFPGPLFEGNVRVPLNMAAGLLRQYSANSWFTISTMLFSIGSYYQPTDIKIDKLSSRVNGSEVKLRSAIGVGVFVLIAIVFRTVLKFTLDNDEWPQLNTVNGMSSVIREEREPSGRSLVTGQPTVLGFAEVEKSTIRFGPLHRQDTISKRTRDHVIV